jgi:hypothetical protein
MTATCPAGHASDESDYCSVCGAAISAAAAAGVLPARAPAAPNAARGGVTPLQRAGCPVCGEPRADLDARFCEVCRYDFVARTGGGPPAAAPPPPPPAPAAPTAPAASAGPAPAPSPWLLVLTIDPSLDTEPDPAAPPPAEPERVFPVEQAEMLVGRRDDRQNIRPAVPLHDPGASRRHAKFLFDAQSGVVSLHDLASTNGTQLNGQDVVSGSIRPLKDGDEVTLGRWTRIRLKARA